MAKASKKLRPGSLRTSWTWFEGITMVSPVSVMSRYSWPGYRARPLAKMSRAWKTKRCLGTTAKTSKMDGAFT